MVCQEDDSKGCGVRGVEGEWWKPPPWRGSEEFGVVALSTTTGCQLQITPAGRRSPTEKVQIELLRSGNLMEGFYALPDG